MHRNLHGMTRNNLFADFHFDMAPLSGPYCRGCGVPPGRECSGNFSYSAILAIMRTLTGSRGEYLRVVGIHSDG